jgi:hypothetical protein
VPLQTDATLATSKETHRDLHNSMAVLLNSLENAPRGIVATGSRTTNFTLADTSEAAVPSLTLTFTTIAGRRYRCSSRFRVSVSSPSYPGHMNNYLYLDDVMVDHDRVVGDSGWQSNYDHSYLEYVTLVAPSAASHTWKIQAQSSDWHGSYGPPSVIATAAFPAYIILEDIGV